MLFCAPCRSGWEAWDLCFMVASLSSTSLLPYLSKTHFTHFTAVAVCHGACLAGHLPPELFLSKWPHPCFPPQHGRPGKWGWGCVWRESKSRRARASWQSSHHRFPAQAPALVAESLSPQISAAVLHLFSPSVSLAGATRPVPHLCAWCATFVLLTRKSLDRALPGATALSRLKSCQWWASLQGAPWVLCSAPRALWRPVLTRLLWR